MHLLTVVFGNVALAFMYQERETAQAASRELTNGAVFIELTDDFGQHASIRSQSIHGFNVEDLDKSKLARAEQMLHQARSQTLANKQAMADPALRMAQSPAVLTPQFGPNGGMHG